MYISEFYIYVYVCKMYFLLLIFFNAEKSPFQDKEKTSAINKKFSFNTTNPILTMNITYLAFQIQFFPVSLSLPGNFDSKAGHISPKRDNFGTVSDQISVHFGDRFSSYLPQPLNSLPIYWDVRLGPNDQRISKNGQM